ICERSLTQSTGGPSGPNTPNLSELRCFLVACSVPEVLRPLYESPKILAQKMTAAALRHIRQIAHESSGEMPYGAGRQPAVLRTFSQRLSRGFNDAVSGFPDDGWSCLLNTDGAEDITVTINSSPNKLVGSHVSASPFFSAMGGGIIMCHRSTWRFLREHRSEWADPGIDAYVRLFEGQLIRCSRFKGCLEVIRLEGHGFSHEEVLMSRDMFLLQLCSGVDEDAPGACAQLVFAPIDESFADDAPLLPSGFRVIPLDAKMDVPTAATTRTLDLASALEVGSGGGGMRASSDGSGTGATRSVLTIAFQFSFENHLRESVAAMARQYVRGVMASVQRVAMAIAPSRLGAYRTEASAGLSRGTCTSYVDWQELQGAHRNGDPLVGHRRRGLSADAVLEAQRRDTRCALKLMPYPEAGHCQLLAVAGFHAQVRQQPGFDILETTMVNIQDLPLEAVLDDEGQKALSAQLPAIMQQVRVVAVVAPMAGGGRRKPADTCLSSLPRREQGLAYLPAACAGRAWGGRRRTEAVAWKVVGDDGAPQCLALMLANWTFI
ncbi:Homeobox-leucine zipper protein HOX33, partial [Zea mays]